VVNKSPSLAALLLKIVNSAFYGFSTKIESISRAVTLIGVKEITTLAIGVSALRLFKDIPSDFVDLTSFFKHSFACGLIARMLAAHKNIQPPEQLFVAGLLHDIGRLILLKHFADRYGKLVQVAATSPSSLYILEKMRLGCRHTDVAKHLIKIWNLPPSLADSIYYHHHPSSARDVKRAAVIHLADMIAHCLGLGSSGENGIPQFDDEAVEKLDILPSNLELIIRQAIHQLVFLDSMFQEGALK
jgi:HD-like signal output (HDOD) protein